MSIQYPTSVKSTNIENNTFLFIAGWLFMIVILVGINRTHVGHVIIYYALLLIILFILATEYQQIVPFFNNIQTIGQFNTPPAAPLVGGVSK